jgi:hypothetical protein
MIPSPFDGYNGLNHERVKELSSGTLLTTLTFFFQNSLKNDAYLIGQNYLDYTIW